MINEYQCVNGKIVALDDKKGLKVYDYQDNIDSLLKQENIIENISENIEQLKKEKENILEEKNVDGLSLITNPRYCGKAFICLIVAFLIVFGDICFGTNSWLLKIPALISALSFVPTFCNQYKKYMKDIDLKSLNIDLQLNELKEVLEEENQKLKQLKKDNTSSKIIDNESSISIDNSKIDTISKIENRKKIYQFYRDNLIEIQKASEIKRIENAFPRNNFIELKEISENTKKLIKE